MIIDSKIYTYLLIGLIVLIIVVINIIYYQNEKHWWRIQEAFLCSEKVFWGVKLRSKTISINGKKLLSLVKIKVSKQGIYFKPRFPQRMLSHAALIPWYRVVDVKLLSRNRVRLIIQSGSKLYIDLSRLELRKIDKYVSDKLEIRDE